jgi:hypothetical protein
MNVVESLEWLTSIIKCKRAEYPQCLCQMPRTSYAFKYQLEDIDYAAARELARVVGGDPVYVPDWPNATQIPTIGAATVTLPVTTTHAPAYRQGGFALVWGSNASYEVVSVTSVVNGGLGTISISATVAGYTLPWVAPLRVGTFSQDFTGDRGPHTYSQASAAFLCVDTEDLLSMGSDLYPSYLGYPLVTDPIEVINSISEHNVREVEELDSRTGPIYKYPIYATPNQSAVLAWTAQNAADLWELRVWLHTLRGRWKRFWTSSWNGDVVLTKDIAPGDNSLQVAAMGFATEYPLPMDLAVMNEATGVFVPLRIVSVATSGANELLYWSGSWSGSTWPMAALKVSKLTLSRLDSDRIEIQHLPGRQATIVAATKEVPIYP